MIFYREWIFQMIGIKIKLKNIVDKIFDMYYNLFTLKPYLFKERMVIKD